MATANFERIKGAIKEDSADFLVSEVPLYEPCGEGEHLFVTIRKRDLSAAELKAHVRRTFSIADHEIGVAGQKDKAAITEQTISIPARFEAEVERLASDGIEVLTAMRHRNKLRIGHLKGNRFRILVRGENIDAKALHGKLHCLETKGVGNFFGPQRFGSSGSNVIRAIRALKGFPIRKRQRRQMKFCFSALQSFLFNDYLLERRLQHGGWNSLLEGDIMQVFGSGGLFSVEDMEEVEQRFKAGVVSITGPIYGVKMKQASGVPGALEEAVLAKFGFDLRQFEPFGKFLSGTRRPLVVFPEKLECQPCNEGVWLSFYLPKGCYATTILDELVALPERWHPSAEALSEMLTKVGARDLRESTKADDASSDH